MSVIAEKKSFYSCELPGKEQHKMFLLNFLFPSCVNVCAYAHMEPRGQSWVLFLKSHLPRVVSKGTPEPVAHQPDLLVEFQ